MNALLVGRVKRHLEKHPAVSYRASELAKQLGDRPADVALVLITMREAREVVSCWVTRDGLQEEEFRITAGVPPRLAGPGDSTSLPPKGTRGEHAMWHGKEALRQKSIIEFIDGVGRPVFPSELLVQVRAGHPETNDSVIYCAINTMRKSGALVRLAKQANPSTGRASFRYATPAVASRDNAEFKKGNGGEAGDGKAGRKPAAPRGDEATRPSAEKTAPKGAGVRAGPHFGLLPNRALAIRSADVAIDLSPDLARELVIWLDDRPWIAEQLRP
jgi:hypothetical protein